MCIRDSQYFRSLSSKEGGGAKMPKMPKMPVTYDFQFYNSGRLTELIEKEKTAILAKHEIQVKTAEAADGEAPTDLPTVIELTEEEVAEKEKLLSEGFQDWTKRDFNNYVRACEKWGRDNITEIVKEIEGKTEDQIKSYHEVFLSLIHI